MFPRPLPRAPMVWLGIIGGAAALDWVADRGDADGDTASECFRAFVAQVPAGKPLFAVASVAVPWWFYNHILSGIEGSIRS